MQQYKETIDDKSVDKKKNEFKKILWNRQQTAFEKESVPLLSNSNSNPPTFNLFKREKIIKKGLLDLRVPSPLIFLSLYRLLSTPVPKIICPSAYSHNNEQFPQLFFRSSQISSIIPIGVPPVYPNLNDETADGKW